MSEPLFHSNLASPNEPLPLSLLLFSHLQIAMEQNRWTRENGLREIRKKMGRGQRKKCDGNEREGLSESVPASTELSLIGKNFLVDMTADHLTAYFLYHK